MTGASAMGWSTPGWAIEFAEAGLANMAANANEPEQPRTVKTFFRSTAFPLQDSDFSKSIANLSDIWWSEMHHLLA
jgi:hypothetical protein